MRNITSSGNKYHTVPVILGNETNPRVSSQFYKANKRIVPVLLGSVGDLRANMLRAKLRGQGKAKPVDNSLIVRDHSITVSDGDREVEILLRTYVPDTAETNLPGML